MELVHFLNKTGLPFEACWKIVCYSVTPKEAIEKNYNELFDCEFFYPLKLDDCTLTELWCYVAKSGLINIMEKMVANNVGFGHNRFVVYEACCSGQLKVLQWFVEKGFWKLDYNLFDFCASKGQLNIVEWLHKMNVSGTNNAMDWASEYGHLNVVVWLHQHKYNCTVNAMNFASENGHLDVVVWLHENRSEGCTDYALDNSAVRGHLNVVKWLHKNTNSTFSLRLFPLIVGNRHLNVVKWLYENVSKKWYNCDDAINIAIFNGDLEMVKWLMEHMHRCPSIHVVNAALKNGHYEVVDWLYKTYGYNCNLKI